MLTPSLYCMGPKVSEPKKWLVPNFIFKGWEWCILGKPLQTNLQEKEDLSS